MQSFQEQDYTKRFDLSLWRKLIKVAKPYHKNLIAVVLFMAVSAIIDVIMPNMNARLTCSLLTTARLDWLGSS